MGLLCGVEGGRFFLGEISLNLVTIGTVGGQRTVYLSTHVPNQVPLDQGVTASSTPKATGNASVKALRAAWLQKKPQIFAGKLTKPDAEDPDTVNHLNWYLATGFTRPYPGESKVRPPSEFNNPAPKADVDE